MVQVPLLNRGSLLQSERPQLQKQTYFVQTWGCQMNEEDSEQLSLLMENLGFSRVDTPLIAHVILLNTCSVRRKPEDKAFSFLGELGHLKKREPETIIGVCGCMAQVRADEILKGYPHVDFVMGTGDLGLLTGLVEDALIGRRFAKRTELPVRRGKIVDVVPQRQLNRPAKIKAYIPIQYGCDKFCTYCIVPNTRGRERSRPTIDILEEIRALAGTGTKEITLLGQTVNSYGKNLAEGVVPFSDLLWKASEIDGLERIRFMSPYPRDFKRDLIETIRDCPKVMESVHMPLQAGDNAMLSEMKRVYTVESYRDLVAEMRETIPGITITTDIIVGFPGETDEQFDNTLSFTQEMQFDGAYMFAYSIRPGTPAGDREDQVPQTLKMSRLTRLIETQNLISKSVNEKYIGKELEVLVDGKSSRNADRLQGYSRESKMVHFSGSESRIGRITKMRATDFHQWGLDAELI